MKQFCLACDLKDDEQVIRDYDNYHKQVWPQIKESIRNSGIQEMQIYRTGNRLFMILQVVNDFTFEQKAALDISNPIVQKWEGIMAGFQQRLPWAEENGNWLLMDCIFKLEDNS